MFNHQIFKRYYLSNSIFINKLYITMNKINLFDTEKTTTHTANNIFISQNLRLPAIYDKAIKYINMRL